MFNPLCSSTNQQLFKNNFCNQSSRYENYGQFNGSHHVSTTKLTVFMVIKNASRSNLHTCHVNFWESWLEYGPLVSDLELTGFGVSLVTIEIGCLGHFLPTSI